MDETGRHAKRNKPDTTGQILYDSPYMMYLEELNSQRQKVKQCFLRARGKMDGELFSE